MKKLLVRKIIVAVCVVAMAFTGTALAGCSSSSSTDATQLEHGELLDETFGDGYIVLKAKIKSSYSNEATVAQNYYNVCDYIQNNDMTDINEIQYWAVADMSNGEEQKVVSFTVPRETIELVLDGSIADNMLGNYVDDLYIHASLS